MSDSNSDPDVLIAKDRAARQQQWAVQRMFTLIGLLAGVLAFGFAYSGLSGMDERVQLGVAGLIMFIIMFPLGMLGKYQGERAYKRARSRYGLTGDSVKGPVISPDKMKIVGIVISALGIPLGYGVTIAMSTLYSGPSNNIVVLVMGASALMLLLLTGISIYRVGQECHWYSKSNE